MIRSAFAAAAGGFLGLGLALTSPAAAQTPAPAPEKPAAPAAEAPEAPKSWASSITLSAQFEGGVVFNPSGPKTNFGQLFTDKPNTVLLNQALFTAARVIDPKQTDWDVGFKLQVLYGTDARYAHVLGEFDHINSRYQLDIVEANVTVHMPLLTEGGIDLKVGQYSTPIGFETIDPSTNPFYSHSYIFNFGIPLSHTGGLAIVHATPVIDIYGGIDSGVNTSVGVGDNNSAAAGIFGFGLNLLDGKLTVLALTHMGPENPSKTVPNANAFMRYLNDVIITYKATDKLSFTTELNYIVDDFAKAGGYGAVQYVSYALTDEITLNGRAEIWRDNKNFFVAAFPGNQDFVNAQLGNPNTSYAAPKAGTYSEFTAGLTYKPAGLPAPVAGLMIRPEIRYDASLNNSKPFKNGKENGAFTIATDFILSF